MSRHAPGPWRWAHVDLPAGLDGPFCELLLASNDVAVLRHAATTWTVRKEDAHLIAAGPELLAACEEARDALRFIRDEGLGLIAQHGDALDMLLAAIAKARGER